MQTKTAHTPAPWVAVPVKGSYKRPVLIQSGTKLVASVNGTQLEPEQPSIGEAEANAEFIVRACNAHADLLEAAKDTLEALELNRDIHGDIYGSWMNALRAAISKAQGD